MTELYKKNSPFFTKYTTFSSKIKQNRAKIPKNPTKNFKPQQKTSRRNKK